MSWHERWFYVDWMLDERAEEEAESTDPFDPNKPWEGRALTPDVAVGLGFNVREIQ